MLPSFHMLNLYYKEQLKDKLQHKTIHEYGDFSKLKHQTLLIGLNLYYLQKNQIWFYQYHSVTIPSTRVVPITVTLIHVPVSLHNSNKNKLSSAKPPPPTAPPNIIIKFNSIGNALCAALLVGTLPLASILFHFLQIHQKVVKDCHLQMLLLPLLIQIIQIYINQNIEKINKNK
ncbi:unnamed protein product [Paramecium pentaurelia]|uniref:Transmembrane protein n=1 Tax=Paramecium pentaurelia TaxID=43138 RepID=A0A8S1W6B1_9CILI|nr:unnamed protein product [Paramecium pentaurelia]